MKFRMMMKDPDGPYEAIRDAVDPAERTAAEEARSKALSEFVASWLEYGEYATIEFDTEAKTARLLTVEEASKPMEEA